MTYEPSQLEIKTACENYQRTWTEQERTARRFWTVEKVEHRGSDRNDRNNRPLDWGLRRPLTSDLPQLETTLIPLRELVA